MKTHLDNAFCPAIEHVIKEIVRDDSRYALTEMRSMHRDNLVVPVNLTFSDGSQREAVSRNISPVGVCLISLEPIEVGLQVELAIYRLKGQANQILSEVRWCKPFGEQYFMSGWKFLQLRR